MVLENAKKFIDFKGISIAEFERNIGMSNNSFRKSLNNGGNIGSDKLENILRKYPEINASWLITGEGPMLKDIKNPDCNAKTKAVEHISIDHGTSNPFCTASNKPIAIHTTRPNEGIPLIPIEAMAGSLTNEQTILEYECERYVIPMFKGADFLIPVKGSSMYPKYSSGDIVACQRVSMSDLFFQWNKVYVIDTSQGALIKRIKPGSDKEHISIISDNPNYDPFELHLNAIHAVALVIGVIRLE